jgi:hypothetical protein
MHQPCVRRQSPEGNAGVGDWQCAQPGAVRKKQLLRARVARFFDRDFVVWIQQQPRTEIECLLRAADDDDLVGRTSHGAGPREVRGNRFAKGSQSCR